MNPNPASEMQRATSPGPRSIRAPSASSVSPLVRSAIRKPAISTSPTSPAMIRRSTAAASSADRSRPDANASIAAVSAGSGTRVQEIGQQLLALVGQHGFGMELHALGCQLAQVLDEVVGERVVVVDDEYSHHGHSGCSAASSSARRTARALASLSANSYAGLASATVPPPACTCATPSATTTVRMWMQVSRSPV